MAKEIIYDAVVTVAGTAISDHVAKVTIEMKADDVDVTSMGSTAKERRSGIRDDQFTLEVFQDFATGSVDLLMYPLMTSGTSFVVTVKKSSAAAGNTNPIYFGTCVLLEYSPLDVEVANASKTTLTMPTYSGAITRGTA
jgi:hypothetical protein